jgi:hypothetical protein
MAFGRYPEVTVAQARARHATARSKLHEGTDPMAERSAEKSDELESRRKAKAEANGVVVNPFRDVAARWFAKWRVGKVERYVLNTQNRLNNDILNRIGNRPIAKIKPPEIASMILAIEERGAEDVARRTLQTTQQIFRYAMAFGLAEQNPAMAFRPSDILQQRVTTNFARVDVSALPDLLKKIEYYDGSHFVRLALQLMTLVFVRTGELIPAKWSEFDRKDGIWNVPAARMKMRRPHLDEPPLCQRAPLGLGLRDEVSREEILLPTIDENYRAIDRKYWTVSRQPFSLFAERARRVRKKMALRG